MIGGLCCSFLPESADGGGDASTWQGLKVEAQTAAVCHNLHVEVEALDGGSGCSCLRDLLVETAAAGFWQRL